LTSSNDMMASPKARCVDRVPNNPRRRCQVTARELATERTHFVLRDGRKRMSAASPVRRLRAYAFGLVTTLLFVVLVLAERSTEQYVSDRSRLAGTAIEVAIVVLAALAFRPLHKRAEQLVEAAFTKRRREARQILSHLQHELTSFHDVKQVLRRVVEAVDRHMSTEGCAIYLCRGRYAAEASSFDVPLDAVEPADALVVRLRSAATPADPRALKSRVHGELAFPMMAGGELIGFLTLTPKRIEYEAEDLRALGALADTAGVALLGLDPRLRIDTSSNLRLAVLPFASMSPDPSDDYFADGLTDELITQASRIPRLRVVARTSVIRYKGSSKTLRDIAQDLGVHLVLEGSVRKAGNHVRITAKLVNTSSEDNLWSFTYDRSLDDIFRIQDDIAGQVATSIIEQVTPRRGEPSSPFVPSTTDTTDMDAYISFLHGRKLLSEKASEETIRQALTFFETSVRRDPQFARARVGIAECSLWLGNEGAIPYLESVMHSREELAKALAHNDAIAEAHSALACLLLGEDDMSGSEREARRAMELNPSLSDPYRWLAQLAAGSGKIDETVRLLEAAQQLNPVDVNIIAFLGRAYFYAGREAEALAHWERTKPLIPFRTNAHLTEYYLSRQDYAKVEATLREMGRLRPHSVWTETYRGFLAARRGDAEGARRSIDLLERSARSGELTVFHVGFVHFALKEMDAFVTCMEQAFQLHALPLLELQHSPLFEPARSDPRILDLLRRQVELRSLTH
jgi:TolB-like protein